MFFISTGGRMRGNRPSQAKMARRESGRKRNRKIVQQNMDR